MPAFHFRHIKNLYAVFWEKSQELIREIETSAIDFSSHEPTSCITVEVNSWASRATLDIIGKAGLGRDFNTLKNPANALHQSYREVFSPGRAGQVLGLLGAFLPAWIVRSIP